MPTYMYKCQDCGHRFEQVQGFHDDPLEVCPDCGGTTRRVIGNVGVTFKGSGFYRTDSRAASAAKQSAGTKDTGTKDKGTQETGSRGRSPQDRSSQDKGSKDTATKSGGPATDKSKGSSPGAGSSSTSS